MRNLKRALSLAMASIMILGMMVVGAGAVSYDDFSDKDKIVNQEAVNTMVSLGVINGKEDGSYDPAGIVTRAEMAKLIAVMMTGGKDPTLGNISSNFSDTKGNWADAYIAYCANKGIINGRGDGTFGPGEAVTGSAAAKMILTALGYRADVEKLTGAEWEINTNVLANKVKLYDGIEAVKPQEGLSRDNTAQMIYNGVQSEEVEYRNNYGEYSGVIYAQPNGTVLNNRFNVVKVEGVVVANDVFGVSDYSAAPVGKTRLENTNTYTTTSSTGQVLVHDYSGIYAVAVPNEMVGTRIVIYVKFNNALAPNAANSSVIGTPISSNKNTIVSTAGKLKDDEKVKDLLRDNDLSIGAEKLDDNTVNTYRGMLTVNPQTFQFTKGDVTLENGVNPNGTVITFIDHTGDGTVDYILKETAKLAKITVYNATDKKLTVAGVGEINFKNIANPEDVALNDMVLWTKYDSTYFLAKPETVQGTFEAYNKDADKMVVDGTAYGATSVGYTRDGTTLEDFKIGKDLIGTSYTLYLDLHQNCIAIDLYENVVPNYALVLASAVNSTIMNKGEVKLLLGDGSVNTYNVNMLASASRWGYSDQSDAIKEASMAGLLKDPDNDGPNPSRIMNTIVTYAMADDGKVIIGNPALDTSYSSLSIAQTDSVGAGTNSATVGRTVSQYTFNKAQSFVNGSNVIGAGTNPDNSTSIVVNDNTLFFFKKADGTTYAAVQGLSKLPTTAIAGSFLVSAIYRNVNDDKTSTAVARAVYVQGEYVGALDYVYISGDYTGIAGSAGSRVYTFPAVFDTGKKGEVKVREGTSGLAADSISSGEVYSYTTGTNGYSDLKQANIFNMTDTKNKTVNGYVATYSENGSVTMRWGKNNSAATNGGRQDLGFTVSGDAKVWNVEGDNPVATTLTANASVAIATDSNGFIKAAFVKKSNVVFRNFTNSTGAAITLDSGNVASNVLPAALTNGTLASGSSIEVATGFGVKIMGVTAGITKLVNYDRITDGGEKTALTADSASNGTCTVSMPSYSRVVLNSVSGGSTTTPDDATTKVLSVLDSKADIEDALKTQNVFIKGAADDYNIAGGGITIPEGRTLTFAGDLAEASGNEIKGSGTLQVNGTYTVYGNITNPTTAGSMVLTNDISAAANITVDGDVTGTSMDLTILSSCTMTAKNVGTTTSKLDVITISGTLNADSVNAATTNVLSSSSLTVANDVTSTINIGDATNAGKATIGGKVIGDVTVTKGEMTVTGTITGVVTVTGGTLKSGVVTGATFTVSGTGAADVAGITTTSTVSVTGTGANKLGAVNAGGTITLTNSGTTPFEATSLKATGMAIATSGSMSISGNVDAGSAAINIGGNGTVSTGTLISGDSTGVTIKDTVKATITATQDDGATPPVLTGNAVAGNLVVSDYAGLTTAGKISGTLTSTTSGTVVTGGVATLTNNTTSKLTINGDVGTVADVTSGDVTINGKITTKITNVTNGTLVVNGDVVLIDNITDGDVTINGTLTTLTKLTAGTLNMNGDITTQITAVTPVTGGILNISGAMSIKPGSAVTVGSTINLVGSGAALTIDGTSAALTLTGKITGETGAKVIVSNASNAPVVQAGDKFYANNNSTALTALAAKTYVYGTVDVSGTPVTGFIATT